MNNYIVNKGSEEPRNTVEVDLKKLENGEVAFQVNGVAILYLAVDGSIRLRKFSPPELQKREELLVLSMVPADFGRCLHDEWEMFRIYTK